MMTIKASIYSILFALARGRNRSHAADSGKIDFIGVPSLMHSHAGHFEATESKLGPFKSMVCQKFYTHVVSVVILAQFTL